MAEAAGYSDGERWWEHMVEHRRDSADVFAAVLEAMTALRAGAPPPDPDDPCEAQREAHMRQTIRAAQAEGFARIAVVCGAWHAPGPGDDAARAGRRRRAAAGPARVTVAATWVPWTYGRLACTSGYGAGVELPGWYDAPLGPRPTPSPALADAGGPAAARRKTSTPPPPSVIEAVRLAEALAALRDRPSARSARTERGRPQAVLCGGNDRRCA